MSEKKDTLDKLVGFNVTPEQKELLKVMAEYLHLKGIIKSNTYAEAARWSISTIASMIKEVIDVELKGKIVTTITIPLLPVSTDNKLAMPSQPESSADI